MPAVDVLGHATSSTGWFLEQAHHFPEWFRHSWLSHRAGRGGDAGTSPPRPAIRARLRAEGLAMQGCISPWPPGLGGSGPFPVFPTRSCPAATPVISTSHSQQPGTDVSPGAFRHTRLHSPGPVFSIHCSVSFPTTMEEGRKNQLSYKPLPSLNSPPLKSRRTAKGNCMT